MTINANDSSFKFLMLVDSGADTCIFDSAIAELFGIDYEKGDLAITSGIGGSKKVYYFDDIFINIGGHELKIKAGFIEEKLVGGKIAGLLGRKSFFEAFKVCIDEKKGEIELKENIKIK